MLPRSIKTLLGILISLIIFMVILVIIFNLLLLFIPLILILIIIGYFWRMLRKIKKGKSRKEESKSYIDVEFKEKR